MVDGPSDKAIWRDKQNQAVRNAALSKKQEKTDNNEKKNSVEENNTKNIIPNDEKQAPFSRETLSTFCNKYVHDSDVLKQNYARIGKVWLANTSGDQQIIAPRLEALYKTLLAPHKTIKKARVFPTSLKNQLQRLGINNPDQCVMNGTYLAQQLLNEIFMVLNYLARDADDMHVSTTLRDLVAVTAHSAIHVRKHDCIERGFALVDFCQILLRLNEYCMQEESGMIMRSAEGNKEMLLQVVSSSSAALKYTISLTPDGFKELGDQSSQRIFNESTIELILHKILLNHSSTCVSAQLLHKAVIPVQEKLNESLCVTRQAVSLDELMSSPDTMLLTIFLHAVA